MARPVRIHLPGATYLVQIRAHETVPLFASEEERGLFMQSMQDTAGPHQVRIYAFALLVHSALLFVRCGELPLSRFVHRLQASYFNRLRPRRDPREMPALRDRHRAILVEEQPYFQPVLRRVHLAPVIGGHWSGESEARRWGEVATTRWTSWPIYTGEEEPPVGFDRDGALQHFENGTAKTAEDAFYRYMMEGVKGAKEEDVLDRVVAMSLLGSDSFVREYYEGAKGRRRLPRREQSAEDRSRTFRRIVRLVADYYQCDGEDLLRARSRHPGRKYVVELAMRHALGNGGVKQLGRQLNVSGSALAHLRRGFLDQMQKDAEARRLLEELEAALA